MDILTALDRNADYSKTQLQFIFSAWVLSGLFDKKKKISLQDGDVAEDDYDKRSIYSLLYSLYRSMGDGEERDGRALRVHVQHVGLRVAEVVGAVADPRRRSAALRQERLHRPLPVRRR